MRPDCLAPCAPYSWRRSGRQAAASPGRLLWTPALTPTTLRFSPRVCFRAARSPRRRRVDCSLFSLPFYLAGAWPIVGFLGLDVAALWFAFRLSFRAARAYEDYRLTYLELEFTRVSAHGARREWRFNPAWVMLERGDAGTA